MDVSIKYRTCSDAKIILDQYIKDHGLIPATTSHYPNAEFELLAHLFNEERLERQYSQLTQTLPIGREAYQVQDPIQRLMKSYMAHNDRQFTLTSVLRSQQPQSPDNLADQSLMATVLLERLSASLQILPQLTSNAHIMQVWNSSINWQYCRTILILYDFVTRGLPELTELLFATHQNDPRLLLAHYAECGRLVTEIMKFLEAHVQDYRRTHRDLTKSTPGLAVNHDEAAGTLILPGDLYGLRVQPVGLIDITVVLKNKSLKRERMYSEGKDIFTNILISHLVVPHLLTASSNQKQKHKHQADPSRVIDDYLLRGAVLQAIVEETDDESIFASSDIQPFLFGSILPL